MISTRFARLIFPLLILTCCSIQPLRSSFRVPYQYLQWPLECSEVYSQSRSYFRPEYAELVQRLDPETMRWLIRTYPVLGWQSMDPRPFVPKPIPGDGNADGFRYDTGRRNMEMESLFHFGPFPGNGTLISELIEVDQHRLLTVNIASRNLSVIDLSKPDLEAVIPVPLGLQALEINLPAGELYLIERGLTKGMLIYSLKNYTPVDTMMLDFHPGAVLLSPDTRYLYMTDEQAGYLVCWDLADNEPEVRVATDLSPPYLLLVDHKTATPILISRATGRIELFKPSTLEPLAVGLALDGPLLDYYAPPESDLLFLASGSCESSTVYSLSLEKDASQAHLENILGFSGPVKDLTADPEGGFVYLIAGGDKVYRVDVDNPRNRDRIDLQTPLQRVLFYNDRVYVTGGLKDVFLLKKDLGGEVSKLALEMGPGPMVAVNDRLIVANGLSSSITILDAERLKEEVSVLVGVLLGRVFYHDRRLVVNNIFRGNIMVYDPDNLLIEDIIPIGGSLDYIPESRDYMVFDDSLVAVLESPPSRVAMRVELDLPRGVRLYTPTAVPGKVLIADQGFSLLQVDLEKQFRYSGLSMPGGCTGLFNDKKQAWAFFPAELYRFSLDENGPSNSFGYSARPYKMSRRYLASGGFGRSRGSELYWVADNRLVELMPTRSEVQVIRHDPDTTYTYIGTSDNLYIFERGHTTQRSIVTLADGALDIYLPSNSAQAFVAGREGITVVNRESLFKWDDIGRGGSFVYVGGDDLFLRDFNNGRKLYVADGYRGMIFQEIDLPLTPTDAVADQERLFLVGAAEGAVAVYVNWVDTSRLPRSPDRRAWDPDADRRASTHR
jgi:hypothetical protein